jgi:hypothetical protein
MKKKTKQKVEPKRVCWTSIESERILVANLSKHSSPKRSLPMIIIIKRDMAEASKLFSEMNIVDGRIFACPFHSLSISVHF